MTQIICELATNHGGDVDLAADMIRAAAEAGADYAKLQTYTLEAINPADPQAAWLRQAHLDRAAHERLIQVAQECGIGFLSTPFDFGSLAMLRSLGVKSFKIASSESSNRWWMGGHSAAETWFVSYPWGMGGRDRRGGILSSDVDYELTAIPLYPTPLEAVGRATLLDGWSDHTIGLDACLWAIAQGAKVIEVHFTTGKGRVCAWDKTPEQVRELKRFAGACETMRTGVAQTFRERWVR